MKNICPFFDQCGYLPSPPLSLGTSASPSSNRRETTRSEPGVSNTNFSRLIQYISRAKCYGSGSKLDKHRSK